MKEFKGTKGKWEKAGSAVVVNGVQIADVYCYGDLEYNRHEAVANAQLIATAPELAKALQEAIELFDSAYTCMENGDNEGLYNTLANATSRSNFKEVLIKAIGE